MPARVQTSICVVHTAKHYFGVAQMVRRLLDLAEAETDRLALFEDTIEMVQHDSYPSKCALCQMHSRYHVTHSCLS